VILQDPPTDSERLGLGREAYPRIQNAHGLGREACPRIQNAHGLGREACPRIQNAHGLRWGLKRLH
jgi:hypothetical protein